jgi:hypothetical protein
MFVNTCKLTISHSNTHTQNTCAHSDKHTHTHTQPIMIKTFCSITSHTPCPLAHAVSCPIELRSHCQTSLSVFIQYPPTLPIDIFHIHSPTHTHISTMHATTLALYIPCICTRTHTRPTTHTRTYTIIYYRNGQRTRTLK